MQRICSQQSRADAYSWRVMSRALGCALLPSVYPQAFRPSSILLDSSYPLVFLMRLEQGPLPGGAARCSSGMASVLELEGKGPELFVRSWHMCDDQLHFSTEICLFYLPWRNACIQQHSSSYLWNWPQVHTQKMGGNKKNLEMPSKIKNHKALSALKHESWQSKWNLQPVLPCFYPHLLFIFPLWKQKYKG